MMHSIRIGLSTAHAIFGCAFFLFRFTAAAAADSFLHGFYFFPAIWTRILDGSNVFCVEVSEWVCRYVDEKSQFDSIELNTPPLV